MLERLEHDFSVAAAAAEQHCAELSQYVGDESRKLIHFAHEHPKETAVTTVVLTAVVGLSAFGRAGREVAPILKTAVEGSATEAPATIVGSSNIMRAAGGAEATAPDAALLSDLGQTARTRPTLAFNPSTLAGRPLDLTAKAGGPLPLCVPPAETALGSNLAGDIVTLKSGARLNTSTLSFGEGTGLGKSWRKIFHDSFPRSERDATSAVVSRIRNDGSVLYETKASAAEAGKPLRDRTIAMSIVEPIGSGSLAGATKEYKFLPWHAVSEPYRSSAVGGQHLEQILARVRGANDTAAIALEIEHTGLKRLPDAATIRDMIKSGKIARDLVDPTVTVAKENQTNALRRAAYYLEHGAKVADVKYSMPDLEDASQPPLPAHLLYFEGTAQPLGAQHIRSMVKNIFVNGYELPKNDDFIKGILSTVGHTAKAGG